MTKVSRVNLLTAGAHRGARALIRALPEEAIQGIAAWGFVDAKPGRAEETAAYARERFPNLRTAGADGDGVSAASAAGRHTITAASFDSVGSTIGLVAQPRDRSLFQIVGRGPGGPGGGNRLGLAGLVDNEGTRNEALLYLRGLQSLTARETTTSGALTRSGDPLTAALLGPMRDAASYQTARYISDLAADRTPVDPRLMFFAPGASYPLTVLADEDDRESVRAARAIDSSGRFPIPRSGHAVAVAFVNIADRAIRTYFVSRSSRDARRVTGVNELRVPARLIVPAAVFTD